MKLPGIFGLLSVCTGLSVLATACTPPDPPPPRPPRKAAPVAATEGSKAEDPQAKQAARTDGLTGGKLVFEEHFDGPALSQHWLVRQAGEWQIAEGWLKSERVADENQRNQGIWLQTPLPKKTRVSFKSRSLTKVGDTKCEIFNVEPRHEQGYSVIFGGWNNTTNAIARKGEHEANRRNQSEPPKVEPGRTYAWTIVRTDAVVRWYIDGKFMLAYDDPSPVDGNFFGFNNWSSDLRFDDVVVYEL